MNRYVPHKLMRPFSEKAFSRLEIKNMKYKKRDAG